MQTVGERGPLVETPHLGSRLVPKADGSVPAPLDDPLGELARVPKSVPMSRVRAFLADLGFELRDVFVGQGGVSIHGSCITVTLLATNEQGKHYVDLETQNVAVHRLSIPIVKDDDVDV